MGAVGGAVGVRHVVGLLDELAVDLVSQGPQVLTGLENPLDDWDRVRHRLHLLQRVEDLHSLVLQAGVALLLLHWKTEQSFLPVSQSVPGVPSLRECG